MLLNLLVENVFGCHGGSGGIFLRGCHNVTIQNFVYTTDLTKDVSQPPPAALDIDESCSKVVLINSFWNNGLVKTGKLRKTFGTSLTSTERYAYPWDQDTELINSRAIEVYDRVRPDAPQTEGILINGTKTWCYSDRLAQGQAVPLPIGSALDSKIATVMISATDGNGILESGQFTATDQQTLLVAGTKRMRAESVADNLCLVPGDQVQLINRLGADIDVVITMFWQ